MINVTKTISERQQLRAASVFYNGMFNFSKFSLPEAVTIKNYLNIVQLKWKIDEVDFMYD